MQVERQAGWTRVWNAAFDYGLLHTRGLQLLSHHGKGNHPCPSVTLHPGELSDGTLALEPLREAGASTTDRLGADTTPTYWTLIF